MLADFRESVTLLGRAEAHAGRIAKCALHFQAYRDYLAAPRGAGSYAEFLARRGAGA